MLMKFVQCVQKVVNIETMMGSEPEEIIEELFVFLLQRYQEGLEESMKGSKFVVKSFAALLREITSKYEGDFYCLNCFHSFRTKNKLKKT